MKYLDQPRASGNPPREYLTAKRHVTVAQMLALDANPVILVPAPGAGKVIVPLSAVISGPGGVAYNQGAGNLAIRYASADSAVMLIDTIAGREDPFLALVPMNAGIADIIENDAIVLATDAPGFGELTEGDYPIDVIVEYQIVAL